MLSLNLESLWELSFVWIDEPLLGRTVFSEVFHGRRPANCTITLQRSCSERQSAASVLAMSPGTCPVKTAARWQEKEDCQPCFWVGVVPRQLVVHYSWILIAQYYIDSHYSQQVGPYTQQSSTCFRQTGQSGWPSNQLSMQEPVLSHTWPNTGQRCL